VIWEQLRVSFVIPAYNEEALIVRCISSIREEIARVGNPVHEIIVVDNASTDLTAGYAIIARARVLHERRKGVTRARQTGFEHARYDIVAFIDADSTLPPGWLSRMCGNFADPDVVAVSGPVAYPELIFYKRYLSLAFYACAKLVHPIAPLLQGGNFALTKKALREAGGFNTDIDFYGEDTDTAVRLSKVGKVRFDLGLVIHTSARRMDGEGFVRIGTRYIANFLSVWITGEPWTTEYRDHRPK
jgi:glycosyltransferase involved in cell wall biosynthesis